jgi:O-antigen/teichoic acid export membrane protein
VTVENPQAYPNSFRGGSSLALGTLAGQLAVTALLLLAARNLTVGELGIALTTVGLASIMSDVFDFGSSLRAIREVSSTRATAREFSAILGMKLFPLGLLIIAGLAASLSLNSGLWLSIAGLIAVRSFFSVLGAVAQSRRKYGVLGASVFIDRLGAAGFGVIAIILGWRSPTVISTAYAFGTTLGCLQLVYRLRLITIIRGVRVAPPWNLWMYAPRLGLLSLMSDLIYLDAIIVQIARGNEAAALFGLPARLAGPALTLSTSFIQATLPGSAAAPSTRQALEQVRRDQGKALGSLVLLFVLAACVSPITTPLLFGSQFSRSAPVFSLYMLAAAAAVAAQVVLTTLVARGRDSLASSAAMVTSFATIILTGIGAATSGVVAAAFGTLVANTGCLVWVTARIRSNIRTEEDLGR